MTSLLLDGMQKETSLPPPASGHNNRLKRQQRHSLYSKGERFVIGHSVAELLEKCKAYDKDFKALIPIGAFLDRFYIPTRYPNGLPGGVPAYVYRRKDSSEAIKMAQKVFDFISSKLSTD